MTRSVIVGFSGTRQGMTVRQQERVLRVLKLLMPTEVHHGDCVGADAELHAMARTLGLRVVIHPPDDERHRAFCGGGEVLKPAPYLRRNKNIVLRSTRMLIAPAEMREQVRSGTWATYRYACALTRPTILVLPFEPRTL